MEIVERATPVDRRSWWNSRTLLIVLVGSLWLVLGLVGSRAVLMWGVSALPQGAALLLSIAALQVLPGLAVVGWLWRDAALTVSERLCLGWVVGIALPPLLLQAAFLLRLPWNSWTTAAYILLAAVAVAWNLRPHVPQSLTRFPISLHGLTVAGLLGLALLLRLFLVRDLLVGLWGDSYQHTMMAQLLVDNSGLFTSWEPYAPLATFTYHYGFHANVAFLHWISGMPVERSLLVMGQIIGTAALASACVLTTRWTRSRAAGLWALLLIGFVNTQPIYYVNWGRYTQLTGQVVLAAVLLGWLVLLEQRWSWRRIAFAAIMTACLMLTHYVVTAFAALFLLAYVVALVIRDPRPRAMLDLARRAVVAAGLALFLALPWLINTARGYLTRNVSGFVNGAVKSERIAGEARLEAIPPTYLHGAILALALLGLCIALSRRNWHAALPAVWSGLIVAVVVPYVLGLPGSGVVNWFTAYIALYVPAIPLAAYALGSVQQAVSAWNRTIGRSIAVAVIVGVSVWGVRWQQSIVDPKFQLFTHADREAMAWIRAETPPDARFLVNMFPAYGDSLFAGSDGGWWIPLLTQRQTTLPPLTYGSERGASPDYSRQINAFGFALREHPLPSDAGIALLRDGGIDYVYVGARSEQPDKLDPAVLREHPAFQVVYERDGVTILAVNP